MSDEIRYALLDADNKLRIKQLRALFDEFQKRIDAVAAELAEAKKERAKMKRRSSK